MESGDVIALGEREISSAAAEVLRAAQVDAQIFFARHARGDWGDAPDWLRRDNENAAQLPFHSHAIASHYALPDLPMLLVMTSRDRSRTRLMLAEEWQEREVGVREGYAIWAHDYHFPNPLIAVEEPIVEAILARLLPVDAAIDVGTGTGRLARKLARGGARTVLGVDATPEMLAVARETVQREGLNGVEFASCEIGTEPLPCDSETFDLLTCGLMLTHVADLSRAVAEYARVVRSGGWLLISDFHPDVARFGWRADYVTPDARYLLPHPPRTRQQYLDAVTEAGCTIHEVHDIALGGEPYGETSEATMTAKGVPPLCLVILAQKSGLP